MKRSRTHHPTHLLLTLLLPLALVACEMPTESLEATTLASAPGDLAMLAEAPFPPYVVEPYDTDCTGSCARRNAGGYLDDPEAGYDDLVYWLGTERVPGRLTFFFAAPFGDGPGEDLALVTGDETWGELAGEARLEVYLGDALQGTLDVQLGPGALFAFDLSAFNLPAFNLPGKQIVADRVVLTNRAPDPPGVNDLATLELLFAGVDQEAVDAAGALTVAIDVKPGSDRNPVNPSSRGVLPVAVLTTATFDAATVNPATVRFGATGTEAAARRYTQEDVDRDGDLDLLLHFETQATGLQCGDTAALLAGATFDGQPVEGTDSIATVGCRP